MARRIQLSAEDIQRAKQLRGQASTVAEYRKALSVILPAELSIDADQTAGLLGTSRRTVFCDRGRIRSPDDTPRDLWGGRRHCAMTIEEEGEFPAQWTDKATIGGVLAVPPIHAALVKRLGHDIPMSTTYRLLARHGWRKVSLIRLPPYSPELNPAEQIWNMLRRNYFANRIFDALAAGYSASRIRLGRR